MIRARAPLRLGLAGGGTDVSPYCDLYGGMVLNATIGRYAYAELAHGADGACVLRSIDQGLRVRCVPGETFTPPGGLALHWAVYNEVIRRYRGGRPLAVELSTFCDLPTGSGLGASSTIVVAMLKAFDEFLGLGMSAYAIAELAFYIERVACGFHGGRQDQFAAAFGGFNFMEFGPDRAASIHPVQVPDWMLCELEASIILYYTGTSRVSAEIITDQSMNIRGGVKTALQASHALKDEAISLRDSLLRGDLSGVVGSMRTGWENKKKLSASISNPRIDAIYDAALQAGAMAGKVSGAGGGGFMMFLAPLAARPRVVQALLRFGGEIGACRFEPRGAHAWRVRSAAGASLAAAAAGPICA